MDFGQKLKEIRKEQGLSQEQLAEKIGVSRQAITKWETGKGMPDIENMMILAEIFKTTIDELVSNATSTMAAANATNATYTSETIYDIDCETHFDICLRNVNKIFLCTGEDEKLHVKLESDTIEDLQSVFKVKLDENKDRLDVNCLNKKGMSKFEVAEALKTIPKPAEAIEETVVEEVKTEEIVTEEENIVTEQVQDEVPVAVIEENVHEQEVLDYQESVSLNKKPSLWEKIKNSKLGRAVSYVLKIRVRVKIELPNALPEGRGE